MMSVSVNGVGNGVNGVGNGVNGVGTIAKMVSHATPFLTSFVQKTFTPRLVARSFTLSYQ